MLSDFEDKVYVMIIEFINLINENDIKVLQAKYGVTKEILDEINEEINIYFGRKVFLSIAPRNKAFFDKNPRPYIETYKMNKFDCWGVECSVWLDKMPEDLILHMELVKVNNEFKLSYKYIGS